MNAILLKTKNFPHRVAIKVDNFSNENILNAISRYTRIDSDCIQQISGSTTYGIYAFRYFVVHDIKLSKTYSDVDFPNAFKVIYTDLIL